MNIAEIGKRQSRALPANFKTRSEEDGSLRLEGYFVVFNSIYEIAPGMTESIAPGAFDEALDADIRCLTDHDTRLVLGRTTAGTFELRQDEHGLWGSALINPNDQDAMNTKARVDRGDVNQASFGFDILEEEADFRDDGSVHWTIKKVKLYECSVVTFPAYRDTNISSRTHEREEIMKRQQEVRTKAANVWADGLLQKLKGE